MVFGLGVCWICVQLFLILGVENSFLMWVVVILDFCNVIFFVLDVEKWSFINVDVFLSLM